MTEASTEYGPRSVVAGEEAPIQDLHSVHEATVSQSGITIEARLVA